MLKYIKGLALFFCIAISYADINPYFEVTPLFYIPYSLDHYSGGSLDGPLFKYNEKNSNSILIGRTGNEINLSLEELSFFIKISKSVFETSSKYSGRGNSYKIKETGSAFHIGDNIILTNSHVFNYTGANSSCSQFRIKIYYKDKNTEEVLEQIVTCKEELYCNKFEDFCFVEMKSFKIDKVEYELKDFAPPLKLVDELNEQKEGVIQLASGELQNFFAIYYSVNNSNAFGLQGTSGFNGVYKEVIRGFTSDCDKIDNKRKKEECLEKRRLHTTSELIFHASLFKGASGSPVLDRNSNVLAIHKSITKGVKGSLKSNIHSKGIPTFKIIEILKEDNKEQILKVLGH